MAYHGRGLGQLLLGGHALEALQAEQGVFKKDGRLIRNEVSGE